MLRFKELDNRIYSGKRCIGFQVHIVDEQKQLLEATYTKENSEEVDSWTIQVLFKRNSIRDTQVYTFQYAMPKNNMPLELIAATGLEYLRLCLREELDEKTNICFAIGKATEGM